MTKLYVGNLPYEIDDKGLEELFAEYGDVESATIIMDRATGRSKGFGFVELDDEGAAAAMKALNGSEVDGRTIKVDEAKPKK